MKAMELVGKDEAGRLIIKPSEVYPKWADHIIGILEGKGPEVHDIMRKFHAEAVGLGVEAFRLVKQPEGKCPSDLVPVRAQAFEVTRKWFAAQLRLEKEIARTYTDPYAQFKK